MRRLARLLSLTCEDVTRLASESLDRRLSLPERAAVRVHVLYCGACRAFRRQIAFLRAAGRRLAAPADPADTPGLPPEVRARIADALRRVE